MVADLDAAFAGKGLGSGVERHALLVRMAVNEVEDAVRAGAGAVDEVGPGDGALRRNARAQVAETALRPQLGQLGNLAGLLPVLIMLSDSRGSMPSMPMTMTFLPAARETRRTLPSHTPAAGGPTTRRRRPAPLRKVADSVYLPWHLAIMLLQQIDRLGRSGHRFCRLRRFTRPPTPCRPCNPAPGCRTSPAPSGAMSSSRGFSAWIG